MNSSSNIDDVEKLFEDDDDKWTSAEEDSNPTVTVTVSDEDSFIKDITVEDSSNVVAVEVTVYDENGEEVRYDSSVPRIHISIG